MIDIDKEYSKMRRVRGKAAKQNAQWFKGGSSNVGILPPPECSPVRRICISCTKSEVSWKSKSRLCAECS